MGDGSWAAKPDLNFVYETRFDWVRVYQTREQNPLVGIDAVKTDERTQTAGATAGETHHSMGKKAETYELSGRKAKKDAAGVLIRDGRKVIVGQ